MSIKVGCIVRSVHSADSHVMTDCAVTAGVCSPPTAHSDWIEILVHISIGFVFVSELQDWCWIPTCLNFKGFKRPQNHSFTMKVFLLVCSCAILMLAMSLEDEANFEGDSFKQRMDRGADNNAPRLAMDLLKIAKRDKTRTGAPTKKRALCDPCQTYHQRAELTREEERREFFIVLREAFNPKHRE